MATVSERSRELAIALETHSCAEPVGKCEHWNGVIEQALLAERRLAKLEDAEMCDEEAATVDHVARCASDSAAYLGTGERLKIAAFKYMGSVLRAAAEKEVGK
jgi:hypothetical protein